MIWNDRKIVLLSSLTGPYRARRAPRATAGHGEPRGARQLGSHSGDFRGEAGPFVALLLFVAAPRRRASTPPSHSPPPRLALPRRALGCDTLIRVGLSSAPGQARPGSPQATNEVGSLDGLHSIPVPSCTARPTCVRSSSDPRRVASPPRQTATRPLGSRVCIIGLWQYLEHGVGRIAVRTATSYRPGRHYCYSQR